MTQSLHFPQENWLPDMDLNHDKQIQSLLCYRYTIGQTGAAKVGPLQQESSQHTPALPMPYAF